MERLLTGVAALAGGSAVALAAARAHLFAPRLGPAELAMLDSALAIQAMHALALLAVALLLARWAGAAVRLAGWAFLAGTVLFCGAVLLRALAGVSLGPVAPLGGSLLIGGWVALFVAALTRRG
ncbi:DUF423 domain-containing protein [Elioraea tepidiphila]|jgi:uncharacterized membrane protein YgdD (TMEM256/DUF423 family)|uniref:DUF423 domain-containing protein n=1 Tax=Elioraea tepidiphila TaxID=457934 RepID=UPI0003800320|nr:DUF423 domain-containing protein [Elioraea tepidiphila]